MEASALQHSARLPALAGRSPLLRLQSDEKLIAFIRRGHNGAFEALVQRYQPRLLAFCRHMLGSTEDAEDVLQEVFTASYNAMLADERPINARPWLYRIARNRCLNHLRRPVPAGQDSMDIFERDAGATVADTAHKREEFRQVVADVQELPESQRTALLLRELDALSYEQIAEAMEATVPSVKSLLVRARVSLAEAAEARLLSCEEVRVDLGRAAEGIAKTSAPVRRHVKSCDRCHLFRQELRKTSRALAAVYPLGPLVVLKKLFTAKVGGEGFAGSGAGAAGAGGVAGEGATVTGGAAAAGSGSSVAGGAVAGASSMAGGTAFAGGASTVAAGAGAAGTASAGGLLSAGTAAVASKAAVGLAAAAVLAAGAVEVKRVTEASPPPALERVPTRAASPSTPAPPLTGEAHAGPASEKAPSPASGQAPSTESETAAPASAPRESDAGTNVTRPDSSTAEKASAKAAKENPVTAPTPESQRDPAVEERHSTVVLSPRGTNGAAPLPTSSTPQARSGQPTTGGSLQAPAEGSPSGTPSPGASSPSGGG